MKKLIFIFGLYSILILTSCSTEKVLPDFGDRRPSSFQTCFQVMTKFIEIHQISGESSFNFTKAHNLNELEKMYGNVSLIDIQHAKSQSEIEANNKHVLELIEMPLTSPADTDKTSYLLPEEVALILKETNNSKVHKNHYCYDPQNKVGFCFGRATIAHMEALVRGMDPNSIKKIWIAGDMKEWGHHVATLIKIENSWMVVDTNLNKVVSVEEWIKFYKPMKAPKAKDIMVFITRADRFGPYDSSSYSGVNLFNSTTDDFKKDADFYRGYFHDYFEDLDKKTTIEKFPVR
jgi:hypothetical protein